jgi:uncharacterized damage-inducible protein DinB
MDEIRVIRLWYRYNADLRPKYLAAIARLPARKWFLNDGASFPLFEIYLHVLDAYRWWFRYVYQDRVREYPLVRFRLRVRSMKGAQRALAQTTREIHRFVSRLKARDLDTVIEFSAPANNSTPAKLVPYPESTRWRRERITMRAMLWHMVEEELQHRGEMNALLWRHGIEPPVMGIHEWPGGSAILG